MDALDQINAFSNDLTNLCNRYADEFDISTPAITGILLMHIRLLQDAEIDSWTAEETDD